MNKPSLPKTDLREHALPTNPTRQLLTAKETAFYLGVSPKTLYCWAELNKIPHYKMHGCVRFRLEDVEQWLAGCKHGAVSGNIDTAQSRCHPQERKVK